MKKLYLASFVLSALLVSFSAHADERSTAIYDCCTITTLNASTDTTTTVALPLSDKECQKRNSSIAHVTAFYTEGTVSDDQRSCIRKSSGASGEWEEAQPSEPIKTPFLSVKIPELKLTDSTCDSESCSSPWLSEYIQGLYKYGIAAVSILAALALMIAGLFWLTAGGNTERIASARRWIQASIAGLLIVYSPYLLLSFINGSLIKLKPINVKYIANEPITPFSLSNEEYEENLKDIENMPEQKENTIDEKKTSYILPERSIANSPFKTPYSFSIISAAQAGDFFQPPLDVPLVLQASKSIGRMDYSTEADKACKCNEGSKNTMNDTCTTEKNRSTIATSGCGLAALNMVMAAYNVIGTTPQDMRQMADFMGHSTDHRSCGGGTHFPGLKAYAESKGMIAEKINRERALQLIDARFPVMLSVDADSGCTSGYHWIVVTGRDGSDYTVKNSSTAGKSKNHFYECQQTIPTIEVDGVNTYFFVHPKGQPDMSHSALCQASDERCDRHKNCCGSLLCQNGSRDGTNRGSCKQCIANWEHNCVDRADCCNSNAFCQQVQYGGLSTTKCNVFQGGCLPDGEWECEKDQDCCNAANGVKCMRQSNGRKKCDNPNWH